MRRPGKEYGREYRRVAVAAVAVSILALYWFYSREQLLLYGDAVSHINIARRVFDSMRPGLGQLGSPWLPLPHALMLPFLLSDRLWQTGLGGALPSMAAYVLGTLGVYRLVRAAFAAGVAWFAAAVFALNPNLLYLQTTAMTEPLYIALFIWAVVALAEFARQKQAKWLARCGGLLAAAMLTRYDAWFAAPWFMALAAALCLRETPRFQPWPSRVRMLLRGAEYADLRRGLLLMLLAVLVAAAAWLGYNWFYFGDPLEFARGEYSARAIAERTTRADAPPYPGEDHPLVAALYFQKAARLNTGEGMWQHLLPVMAAVGLLLSLTLRRHTWPWLLLWLPLPFYALSVAYGHVPIFLPEWWPFSYYNVRYGLQLLPALAVFAASGMALAAEKLAGARLRMAAWVVAAALLAAAYGSAWTGEPISLREARINHEEKIAFQSRLARELEALPAGSTLLMYLGEHSGAVQRAGVRLERVLHEGSFRRWAAALEAPAEFTEYVVAVEGDAVWAAVERRTAGLQPIAAVQGPSRFRAVIYRSQRRAER